MKIGNWNITDKSIEWKGKSLQRFVVDRETLLQTTPSDITGQPLYRWIVLATDEDWLTHDDLYDLNFAFVYAAGAEDSDFDYEVFDQTVEHQFNILEEEEEGEDDEDEEE